MISRPTGLPYWGASGATNIVEPTVQKSVGWAPSEKPPSSYFNHWQQNTFRWQEYLDDQRAGIVGATMSLRGAYLGFTGGLGASVAPGALFISATGAGATGPSPVIARGTMTQEMIPLALANVDSGGSLIAGVNILGASLTSAGNYAVKLLNPAPAAARAVVLVNTTPNVGIAGGAFSGTGTIFIGTRNFTGLVQSNSFHMAVWGI